MTRFWTRTGLAVMAFAAVMIGLSAGPSRAFERYKDGCNDCHGKFTGGSSPKNTVFPEDSKHEMHRSSSYMNADCNLCHKSGDNENPFLGLSDGTANNPGVGCTGCHGRDYGGSIGNSGVGLRAHHAVRGVSLCGTCHQNDPAPLPENVKPTYYGTVDTNADDPCNAPDTYLENWSIGDTEGLDNDGDDVYDENDSDCASGGCNGNEVIKKAKCKTKNGAVKKAIVKIKNGTAGQTYTCTLDTGQTLDKIANDKGKATFKFKGANAPPCGVNAANVCNQRKTFDCGC